MNKYMMLTTKYVPPPILTVKQACLLMIPVWIFWIYIIYLLLSNNRTHASVKVDYVPFSISESQLSTLTTYFSDKVGNTLDEVKICQIYRKLGGNANDETSVFLIPKQNPRIFLKTLKKKRTCENVPDDIKGRLRPDLSPHNLSLVVPSPLPCVSRHKVAIVIPYRDREEHLITLLNTLHPLLQRQQVQYRVYVVEQFGNDTFNKGVLMNAGVRESLRDLDFGCFVFHDVDLIPEDDRNMYTCPHMPRHMSVAVDKFNYTLPYPLLVGGVFSIRLDHFLAVNGYSNLYWGWGGEDDDMAYRIKYRKFEIIRPPETIARYSMIKHDHRPESPNAIRTALLRMAKKRSSRDGLNTVKYRVVWRHDSPSHTHLMIDIGRNHRWHFMDSQQRLIINF